MAWDLESLPILTTRIGCKTANLGASLSKITVQQSRLHQDGAERFPISPVMVNKAITGLFNIINNG